MEEKIKNVFFMVRGELCEVIGKQEGSLKNWGLAEPYSPGFPEQTKNLTIVTFQPVQLVKVEGVENLMRKKDPFQMEVGSNLWNLSVKPVNSKI